MFYDGSGEDSFANDFWSYLIGAVGIGYGVASLQKLKPNSMVVPLVAGGAGMVIFGGRHYVHHPTAKAMMEASGYATGSNLGALAAANTVTIGGIAPGPIRLNRIPATASAGGARARVNGAIDARRGGGGGHGRQVNSVQENWSPYDVASPVG